MGVNPFAGGVGSVYLGELNGCPGPWELARNYEQQCTMAYNRLTDQRVALNDQMEQMLMSQSINAGLGSMFGYGAARSAGAKPYKPYRRPFMARVNYLADKARLRHLRKVEKVAWILAWVWGAVIGYVATTYIIKWALSVTLG